jgi:hypothetical protein
MVVRWWDLPKRPQPPGRWGRFFLATRRRPAPDFADLTTLFWEIRIVVVRQLRLDWRFRLGILANDGTTAGGPPLDTS